MRRLLQFELRCFGGFQMECVVTKVMSFATLLKTDHQIRINN